MDEDLDSATLDLALDSADDEWVPPELAETFRVHNDDTANWVIRKIMEARAYAERCQAWADSERRRAERDEEFFMFRFGAQLRDYTRTKIAQQGGRRKSVPLPAGTAGFRTIATKIVVDDADTLLAWVKSCQPEWVKTVEVVVKPLMNEHFALTGEVPDQGIHVEPSHEKFFVK